MIRDFSKEAVKPLKSKTGKIYAVLSDDPRITEEKIEKGEIKPLPPLEEFKKILSQAKK